MLFLIIPYLVTVQLIWMTASPTMIIDHSFHRLATTSTAMMMRTWTRGIWTRSCKIGKNKIRRKMRTIYKLEWIQFCGHLSMCRGSSFGGAYFTRTRPFTLYSNSTTVVILQCDNYLKMCNDSVMYFKKLFFPTYLWGPYLSYTKISK